MLYQRIVPIADQVLFAVSNFLLAVVLARYYPSNVVAAYGIGLSVGLILQALQRHTLIIPLAVGKKIKNPAIARRWLGIHFIAIGCMLSFTAVLLAFVTQFLMNSYVDMIAISILAIITIYMQNEFSRVFLIAIGRTGFLLFPALLQLLVVGFIAIAPPEGPYAYFVILSALIATALLNAALLIFLSGVPDWVLGDRHLRRLIKRYSGWGTVGVIAAAGYNHVPLVILGVLSEPIYAAAFLTTRNLLQPSQILMRGLDIVDKRKVGDIRARGYQAMVGHTKRLCLLYTLVAGVFGLMVSLGGNDLLELIYGSRYAEFGFVLALWAGIYICMAALFPLESLAYAADRIRTYYLVRTVAGVAASVAAFPLIAGFDTAGAVGACLLGWLIMISGTYLMLRTEPSALAARSLQEQGG